VHATSPAHAIFLDLMTVIKFWHNAWE